MFKVTTQIRGIKCTAALVLSAGLLSCGTHKAPDVGDTGNAALLRCGALTSLQVIDTKKGSSIYGKFKQNFLLQPGLYRLQILVGPSGVTCAYLDVNLEAKGRYTVFRSYDRATGNASVALKRDYIVVAGETNAPLHACN